MQKEYDEMMKIEIHSEEMESTSFYLTFYQPMKQKIGTKIMDNWCEISSTIQQLIISNRLFDSQTKGISHAFVATTKDMNLKDFKDMWFTFTDTKGDEIHHVIDIKKTIHDISEEDVNCTQEEISERQLSLKCLAYLSAKQESFNPLCNPYPNLSMNQKKTYKELFNHYFTRENL